MPLYEYFCDQCVRSFEALVLSSSSRQEHCACPRCGVDSRRILSTVNFAAGESRRNLARLSARDGQPDVTRLTLPPAARLCWMDDRSASRLAAYMVGRGAEYDDTIAARKELALRRGESEEAGVNVPAHSHSPLSDPAVFARRKAAQEEKTAISNSLKGSAKD
jgi:putative FmdB family regulatory protein